MDDAKAAKLSLLGAAPQPWFRQSRGGGSPC